MQEITEASLKLLSAKGRKLALQAIHSANSGHPGGSMSCMDALVELYFREMNVDPANPHDENRDRFVLSKGHCSPALYSVLALRGFFPAEDLKLFRSIEGHYSGHPDMRYVAGVDMSTGSLGQGLSVSVGMALAAKLSGKQYRVYTVCGDGELDEGQIWEATMAAAKFELDNLCLLVDVNGLQIDGSTSSVMPTEPLDRKFAAFNWKVIKVNGHSFDELHEALKLARSTQDKPTCILMETVKGKGISFMENNYAWHGKAPNDEQYNTAISELDEQIRALGGE